MGLEVATFISQLVAANPVGASDPKSQGDDHLRLLKATLLATFPAITGAVTSTHTELNQLHGGVITSVGVGAAATPSYSFAGDTDTGMYHSAANQVAFSANGAQTAVIEPSGLTVITRLFNGDGTVAIPAYTFGSDIDTGMFRAGANDLRFAVGGVANLQILAAQVAALVPYTNADGSAGTPSFSFFNDPDIGMYRAGVNSLGLSAGGTAFAVGTNTVFSLQSAIQFQTDIGSAGTPSHSFFSDTDTGIYRGGANVLSFTTGGVLAGLFDTNQTLALINGAIGAPALTFISDGDTGIFRQGADAIVMCAGGVLGIGAATAAGVVTLTLGASTTARHALFTLVNAGATAGGGAALPATVAGFIEITINSTIRKIPFYAN